MGFAAWLRRIFGGTAVSPADLRKLSATNAATLALSIRELPRGERGWITLPEAAHFFSNEETAYAFGEMDDEGKRRLGDFAAECNCEIQFRTHRSTNVFPAKVEHINVGWTATRQKTAKAAPAQK